MYISPDRARVKRKWSVDRQQGPLVLLAEHVQKKLIQHSWPCQLAPVERWDTFERERLQPLAVDFIPYRDRGELGPDFFDALGLAVRLVSNSERVPLELDGHRLTLPGQWIINQWGKVRPDKGVPF